ncbi:MAG: MFS transporter [Deltaproteobacteria bacterium]|nr:MFS transporter [Deltaproteobacteria bacterium]
METGRRNLKHLYDSMKNRIYYGWWVVILGSLINAVGMGVLYQSFTIFFLPLKRDFAVSSAAISLLYGAARLEGGIEGPIVGHLIDRFGPRVMIFIGAGMAGVGLILLATTHSFWPFFFIYVFIVSLGSNAGFFHPLTAAVNKWFIRHRGVGFACIGASASLGGMVMAPFLSYIILDFGWRAGAVTAGIIILMVALPASLPIHQSPESIGLAPDGKPPEKDVLDPSLTMSPTPEDVDFSVKAAIKTVTFWLLMVILTLRLFVTIALNTHLVPILVWKGVSEGTAAYLVSLFAFSSIFTMLGIGWLGDRWNKPLLCALCLVPTVVAMMGLCFSQNAAFIYFFPVAFAITMGKAPLGWSLIGDFFGRKAYATLRGIMGVSYGTATFFSPIYAGWVFDTTGSYRLVLLTFSIILLVGICLFAMLRRPSLKIAKPAAR